MFDIYIDPSGQVVDQHNNPVPGATVTLLRSDDFSGPFDAVPNGSGIMSPTNQANPDLTDNRGLFGWDVLAGFYVVRAAAPGCVSPVDGTQAFVETPVLTVPPPALNLVLQLKCLPRVAIGNASVLEGQTGTRDVAVPVTLSEVATSPVTVSYRTMHELGRRGRLHREDRHGDDPGGSAVGEGVDRHHGRRGRGAEPEVLREAVGAGRCGDLAEQGDGHGDERRSRARRVGWGSARRRSWKERAGRGRWCSR